MAYDSPTCTGHLLGAGPLQPLGKGIADAAEFCFRSEVSASRDQRRFPPPWRVKVNSESFAVLDATGFPLAYIYFSERVVVGTGAERLTRDQARRIAVNIAKLPQLLS